MLNSDEEKAIIYNAIFNYSLNFIEPELNGTCAMIWKLVLPVLEKGNINYINGSKPKKKANTKRTRSDFEAKPKRIVSEHEAYKDKDNYKDKDVDIKKNKTKKRHPFSQSIYNDNFELFCQDFEKTKTAKENPNIDKKKLFETLELADDKYIYSDWIKTAQAWYKRKPSEFQFSVSSILEKDPAYAIMTKGDKIIHENRLKREMQKQLINQNHDANNDINWG